MVFNLILPSSASFWGTAYMRVDTVNIASLNSPYKLFVQLYYENSD